MIEHSIPFSIFFVCPNLQGALSILITSPRRSNYMQFLFLHIIFILSFIFYFGQDIIPPNKFSFSHYICRGTKFCAPTFLNFISTATFSLYSHKLVLSLSKDRLTLIDRNTHRLVSLSHPTLTHKCQ